MPFSLPDHPVFWFVLGCLAVWRISSALVDEDIFINLRALVGIKQVVLHSVYSDAAPVEYTDIPETFFGKLFSCVWCMSMWIGMLAVPAFIFIPWLFLPFAFSAVAIVIHTVVQGLTDG